MNVQQYLQAPEKPLRTDPLLNTIGIVINQIDKFTTSHVREILQQAVSESLNLLREEFPPKQEEELPVVYPPFLPPLEKEQTYTLVLDLDETLIHYYETETEGHVLVRPGADEFLHEMAMYYEVVIFTAALQDYADWVIDQIDPEKCVKFRLYRQHTLRNSSHYLKDLSRLGRELSKTIIVDNTGENFQEQPENGILIKSWIDDSSDTALLELAPLLREIVVKRVVDVREALSQFSTQMCEQNALGLQHYQLSLEAS